MLTFFLTNLIPFNHNLNASKCIADIILNVISGCFRYEKRRFFDVKSHLYPS